MPGNPRPRRVQGAGIRAPHLRPKLNPKHIAMWKIMGKTREEMMQLLVAELVRGKVQKEVATEYARRFLTKQLPKK